MNEKLWNRDYIALMWANFLTFCSFYMLLAALPLHMDIDMKVDSHMIGVVVGVFSISALLSRLVAGYLTDILPRKQFMVVVLLFFVLSVACYLVAISVEALFWVRLFQGLGWGLITTSSNTIVLDVIPHDRHGEGISYFSTGGTIAMALGPVAGLSLYDMYSFDAVIHVSLFVAIAGFAFSLWARKDRFIKNIKIKKPSSIHDFLLVRALPFSVNYLLIFSLMGLF